MKIPKEYYLLIIIGLFIFAYLLDAVVTPLDLNLPTPYHYLQGQVMSHYPFSTASIFIKAIGLFMIPVWLMSFISRHYLGKAGFLLVIASLAQLYALQDVVTKANVVPLEWSLSLSIAGLALLAQAALFVIKGIFAYFSDNLGNARMEAAIERQRQETEDANE